MSHDAAPISHTGRSRQVHLGVAVDHVIREDSAMDISSQLLRMLQRQQPGQSVIRRFEALEVLGRAIREVTCDLYGIDSNLSPSHRRGGPCSQP